MPLVRLALFPGAAAEHYRALSAALPPHDPPPERLLFAAGPVPGGWQVVQVWTSREALEAFNREVLLPALPAAAFPAPPVVTDLEPVDLVLGTTKGTA